MKITEVIMGDTKWLFQDANEARKLFEYLREKEQIAYPNEESDLVISEIHVIEPHGDILSAEDEGDEQTLDAFEKRYMIANS